MPTDAKPSLTFAEIKEQCRRTKTLWEDPDFPATDSSMFFKEKPLPNWCEEEEVKAFEWKRPGEITANPQMYVGGASRMDIDQGTVGDCWLMASIAALASCDHLLKHVVPTNQSFDTDYFGVFQFNLWLNGSWVEVVIDDRLPTYKDKLVFVHSKAANEFWCALLEKAYAKTRGSYEELDGGWMREGLTDFTGGLATKINLGDETPPNLFEMMVKAFEKGCTMGTVKDGGQEERSEKGLVTGHAYTITDANTVHVQTHSPTIGFSTVKMVRLRNPWGDADGTVKWGELEWNGAWSDRSPEWKNVSEIEKKRIGLSKIADGEFWMSYDDYIKEFSYIEICFLGPDTRVGELLENHHVCRRWETAMYEGRWQANVNAGGNSDHPDTFWTNPKYQLIVEDPDETDDDPEGTVIVGLMSKVERNFAKNKKSYPIIGYYIFKVDDPANTKFDQSFFAIKDASEGGQYAGYCIADEFTREACDCHKLAPGHYVVLVTAETPNQEGDYLLRVFCDRKGHQVKEIDVKN